MKLFAWALTLILLTTFNAQASADASLEALYKVKQDIVALPDMRTYKFKENDPLSATVDKINTTLNKAIEEYLKEPEDQRLLEEILATASEFNKKDGYQPGSVALVPLYKKAFHPKKPNKNLQEQLNKAMGKLPPTDAQKLLKSIQNQYRYSQSGG